MSFISIVSEHLLPVFFVYGLAFFSFGLAASMQHAEDSTFELRDYLWLLAGFGFLHGMSEWADMFSALGDVYWTPAAARIIEITGLYLSLASFVFLLDFGAKAAKAQIPGRDWLRIVSRTGSLAFILSVTIYGLSTGLSKNWLLNSNVAARYLLALPASVLAAVGFARHSTVSLSHSRSAAKIRRSMLGMSACFAAYSFLAGCVVPPASIFPASLLNYATFLHAVGLPVQVFRAACAVCAAFLVHGVLSIFTLESKTRLEGALQAAGQAREGLEVRVLERTRELAKANELLKSEITERTRLEAQARKAREIADEANRAKSEFLANMSHEIRTPLNGVIGMVELSLDTNLTAEQRDYLQSAKTSADCLLTVINDILDFSRIEARKLQLDPVNFSLRSSLGDAVDALALRAEQKGLELACHISIDTPDELIGDAGRLRQIVLNLVGNAIKFTQQGEVVLGIRTESRKDDQVVLHFTVTDSGIGIAKDKQNAIFEAFRQADSSTTRIYGGSGLGLAISSQLVGMMGGRLWVDSDLGQGSKFHFLANFSLPKGAAVSPASRSLLELRDLPVLVVDDNATNRRILHDMLVHWHMKPVANESGLQALATLEQAQSTRNPYSLVIVDRNMPEMDGFAVVERIRRNPLFAGATIMMLSSSGKHEDVQRCKELGVAAYLTKPVQQSALFNAIVTAIDGPPVDETFQSSSGQGTRHEGRTKLRVLLADDNTVNQKLARRILEKRYCIVETTTSGRGVLSALEKQAFDVILMDVQMPEMDGFEATAAIRRKEKSSGKHVPIIAVTAHAMKGDRERCLAAGMDGYIAKPIQANELFAVIERLLPEPAESTDTSGTTGPEAVVDELALRDRVDNDDQLLQELVEVFRQDCPQSLKRIREAIAQEDSRALEMTAHAIKGAVGTFAARPAFHAALRLEIMGREYQISGAKRAYKTLETEIDRLQSALEAISKIGTRTSLE
ncbi:MAG: response regulator [Acidobacteriaceae bacterium]